MGDAEEEWEIRRDLLLEALTAWLDSHYRDDIAWEHWDTLADGMSDSDWRYTVMYLVTRNRRLTNA